MSSGARVHNGKEWIPVDDKAASFNSGSTVPVTPTVNGDGSIFVSIPSFRDGKRCAKTLQSLFENAKNPNQIHIGLIEQVSPEDDFCLEEYCALYGTPHFLRKTKIRPDTTKVMLTDDPSANCPHYDRIRLVAVHNIAAKGPNDARALGRKVLGNEEYCLDVDSHTIFTKDWDVRVKEEWRAAMNEFAIISTVPADAKMQAEYAKGGPLEEQVPRQCMVRYDGSDIPSYTSPADGKVEGLKKPLLSHAWSPAFTFAKCHLLESAPYDPFAPYVFAAEQVPRFARFWTRGYDVYTPSRNIVFHDYAEGQHGKNEWMKQRRERLRKESLERFRSFLRIGNHSEKEQANLGVYGLGKRRSLDQMMKFVGIDLTKQLGNRLNSKCADHTWIPYDSSISPMENMYSNADDLDPQPEYPLRTKPVYFQQPAKEVKQLPLELDQKFDIVKEEVIVHPLPTGIGSTGAPINALFFLWLAGLIVWCVMFANPKGQKKRKQRKKDLSGKDV